MYVQYKFDADEHPIRVLSHGNCKAKSARPYHRTMATTKDRLKSITTNNKPSASIYKDLEQAGGINNIKSSGEIARNIRQAKYFRTSNSSASTHNTDPLLEAIARCKQEDRENSNFVREVIAAPEFSILLASDQQLKDIERFCCNPESFSIFGVDPTFNLGDFNSTVSTYRHLLLKTEQDVHPVRLGPVLIHQRKTFSSYVSLPFSMIKHKSSLSGVLVTGSDGEKPLKDALNTGFSTAAHLLCDVHMEDNIQSKLSQLNIPKVTAERYLTDIFGRRVENKKIKGLVDCSTTSELENSHNDLKPAWIDRHRSGKEFSTYFEKHKLELIKATMSQNIRSMAGLGFPPEVYNQNANECMNSVLKRDIPNDKKRMSVTEFIDHCRSLEQRQRTQEQLAMIGRRELKVCHELYNDLCVDDVAFFRKTEAQKNAVSSKFFNANVRSSHLNSLLDTTTSSESTHLLSVTVENSKILSVPFPIVKEIFKEACELLSTPESIVPAPGCFDTFIVVNLTDKTKPYFVKPTSSGRTTPKLLECDKHCLRYSGVHICSHVVAVAEHSKDLQDYLNSFNECAIRPNLTFLSNMDMPKGRGKKANKATQKRKGPANPPPKPTLESYVPRFVIDPLTGVSQPSTPRTQQAKQNDANPLVHQQYLPHSDPSSLALSFPLKNVIPNPPHNPLSFMSSPTVPSGPQQLTSPLLSMPMEAVPKPSPPPGVFILYLLQFCDPRVSRCYGCANPIKVLANVPPSDLVVVTKVCREYRKEGETRISNEYSNVYFHPNLQCIHNKLPHFLPSFLQIPQCIHPRLNIVHRQHIASNLHTSA